MNNLNKRFQSKMSKTNHSPKPKLLRNFIKLFAQQSIFNLHRLFLRHEEVYLLLEYL